MKQLALLSLVLASAACARQETAGPARKVISDEAMAQGTVAIAATPAGYQPGRAQMAPAPSGLEALVLGVAECPVEDFQVAATCDGMRRFTREATFIAAADAAATGRALVTHPALAVRITAAQLLVQAGEPQSLVDAGLAERDPAVLRAFVHALATHPTPAAVPLFVAAADHVEPAIRLEAVGALAKVKTPDAATKLAAMIRTDAAVDVRRAACASAGKLGDDSLVAVYRDVTATVDDPALYAACMEGVVAMFHDHPSFGTASEGAYRLFLERISATPRTEHSPPWTVMSAFCYLSHAPDEEKLAAWRATATWFDAAATKAAILDVVADKAASWQARTAGIESLVGLGATKAELTALRRGLGSSDDDQRVAAKLDSLAN